MTIETIEQLIAAMKRAGEDVSHVTTADGRVFESEHTAHVVAQKTGRELVRVAGGWLVKNPQQQHPQDGT